MANSIRTFLALTRLPLNLPKSGIRTFSNSIPLAYYRAEGRGRFDDDDHGYGRGRRAGSRWDDDRREPRSRLGDQLKDKDWTNFDPKSEIVEPFELPISSMSPEEVEAFRKDNRITLLHNEASTPFPLQDFSVFPEYIQQVLNKSGFETPMPIQAQGWPIALSGLDLIAIGQTGSGKTLGYLLPALMHLSQKRPSNKFGGPSALVLAPTRELAQQIEAVLLKFTRRSPERYRSVCLFGGSSKNRQIGFLQDGVDLVIATPGRLIDLLEMEMTSLERTTYLVLDEADRMLDMGFEPQIRKIMGQIRPDRQLSMWSATWPEEVKELAEDFLRNANADRQDSHVHLNIGSVELQANQDITQHVEVVEVHQKQGLLLNLLRDLKNRSHDQGSVERILIFAETKRTVDYIDRLLYREGYRVDGIHGDKTQMQRNKSLERFRHGRVQILVATDVASRGLDVDDIQHVINYDFPNTVEDYIHRIGRTGRRGRAGNSHTFFTRDDAGLARNLVKVMKQANQEIPSALQDLVQFKSSKALKKYDRYRRHSDFSGDRPRRYNRDFIPGHRRYSLSDME